MLINKILGIFAELPYFFPKIQSIQSIVQSYYISKSLRFRGSSTYLSRTPSVTGNRRVWTWSGWIKRASLGTTQYLYSSFNAGTNECAIRFNTDNTLEIEQYTSPSYNYRLVTTQVFRDTGAWFHLVVSADTTQLLESSRIRVFINGQEIEDFSTSLYPSRNYDTNFNLTSYTHQIGAWNTSAYFDGYMADVHFVDGDSLLPSSFGEINLLTGVWIPKSYTGFYGTNGFNLRFDDNSSASATAIGKDSSGNGNNWTPNGISMTVGTTYDSILDTPLLSSNNLYYSGWNPNYGLQFRSSASTYLTRTPSASNRRTWTWSGWIKRNDAALEFQCFFGARDSSTTIYGYIGINDNKFDVNLPSFPTLRNNRRTTTNTFTDLNVWYHVCVVSDSTLSSATDRIKIYVNNVLQSYSTEINANQNDENAFNAAIPHSLGRYGAVAEGYFNGILAEINFIDGLALTPSSFAETDSTGRWVPKAYTGSYGTNGFYLNFANRSAMTQAAIGDDASINNNQFQPNNMLITDAIDFTATASLGNYATLSLFKKINIATLINSNLTVSPLGPDGAVSTNFGMVNGKWYWEVTVDTSTAGSLNVGIVNQNNTSWNIGDSVNGAVYNSGGNKFYNNTYNTYGATYTTNDIIGVAYDADLGDLYFYKNGILQGGGAAFTGLSRNVVWDASLSHNGSSSSRTVHINFGQRPFAYTPPTGFLALNTNNLPTPTITNSANYMAATTYTGISAGKSITNTVNSASFQPDLVWIKSRNITGSHHIFDSTRGSSLALFTDGTGGNNSRPNSFTSFNSAGFTVGNSNDGNTNVLGTNYITWQWKKNITAGLDIVTYAGTLTTSGNTAINHNLGVAPKFIISKSLNTNGNDAGNWFVWHASAGTDNFLRLNTTDKTVSISGGGGGTMIAPTSSVFYAPYISGSNVSGNNYIAYVFAEIAGYSKFGNYTGNGNADGPFVFCGFRPKWIMIKRYDSGYTPTAGNVGDWYVYDSSRDTYNGISNKLYPNLSTIENSNTGETSTSNLIDFTSNGFKCRSNNGNTNASGGTYIFAAFAEAPSKYALAESSVNLNKAPENIATNSLRFRSSASAYLSRTPSVAGNRNTWTWAGWVKRGTLGTNQSIFVGYPSSAVYAYLQFNSLDQIRYSSTGSGANLITTAVYRDPSAWYHVVFSYDDTQATASNRLKLYVNGQQITSFATASYPSLNFSDYINSNNVHNIARFPDGTLYFDGYLTDVNFIDGLALSPIAFGEIDSVTGVWTPRRYTGSYGTNGFYLKFGNTASLGQDSSGKGNNWTPNNFSTTLGATYDVMTDVPVNYDDGGNGRGNYCVINPLDATLNSGTIQWGNLRTFGLFAGSNSTAYGSFTLTTGKWYFEINIESNAGFGQVTIGLESSFVWVGNGTTYTSYGIYAVAVDMDAGRIWIRNTAGTWVSGDPVTGTSPSITFTANTPKRPLCATARTSGDNNAGYGMWNFGQQPFAYTPPSGFKTLNTNNLPTPAIINPAEYMAATTYTGTGAAQRVRNTVNNVSFKPDLVWIKDRSNGVNTAWSHTLFDSVRGIHPNGSPYLCTNETSIETGLNSGFGLTSLNNNGFSLINNGTLTNTLNDNYIAWQWKAGSTIVTNTSGTIVSQVNANPTAGFSIVTYTGNGINNATVGHGLGDVPAMIISKSRNVEQNWYVWHKSLSGNNYGLSLNNNSNQAIFIFGNVGTKTSSTLQLVTGSSGSENVNLLNKNYVTYCFAEIAGFSKFGSYTGNGLADGPFIYCGFRPRFIMIKITNSSNDWRIFDASRSSLNTSKNTLVANLSDPEDTVYNSTDILSNGFKLRTADNSTNISGGSFIFAAFAEAPFKYSLAR